MDTRRARREEMGQIGALLEASGLPPLPTGISLSSVLVGREAGSVVGVVALEVVARRGLMVGAAVSAEHQDKGFGKRLVSSLIARAHELGLRELYAVAGGASNAWTDLGFSPVASGDVPEQIKSLRTYPDHGDGSKEILRLELETRL